MNHIRQGQNNNNSKRSRGRGRKPQNSGNRAYDSNGPDVKIRGTATHVCEKYQQLARDAITSGDRVMAENYYQHAEHYYRLIMAAQAPNDGQPRPQNTLGYRPDEDQDYDEDDAANDPAQPQSASQPYHQQNNNNNNGGGERRNNNNGNGRHRQDRNQQNHGGNHANVQAGDKNEGNGNHNDDASSDAQPRVSASAVEAEQPVPVVAEADGQVTSTEEPPRRRAPRRRRPRADATASSTDDAAPDAGGGSDSDEVSV